MYEFIPKGGSDLDGMQCTIDFIWHAGFMFFNSARDVNWESNVLLDPSEIASPYQTGHAKTIHAKHDAKYLVEKKTYPDYRWMPGRLPDKGSVPPVIRFMYSRFIWNHERKEWLEKWNEERRKTKEGRKKSEEAARTGDVKPPGAYPHTDSGGEKPKQRLG